MNFQTRVQQWMQTCFGPVISADKLERNDRFLEEALELVQSLGYDSARANALVAYVFGRAEGRPFQEVGGVMVTLAALCEPNGLDMTIAGETELERILAPEIVSKIRAKQASKPTGSALPVPPAKGIAPYDARGIGAALLDIAIAASKAYTFSPEDGADHYLSDFERGLLTDFFLSLTGDDDFNRVLKSAQDAINFKGRTFVAVDYTGCIFSSEDRDRTIAVAKANAGIAARLIGADGSVSRGALDVLVERRRQIDSEGWTPGHDDMHDQGDIEQAAAAYAHAASGARQSHGNLWPWEQKWWKPGSPRRMLVKAGALIIAAIERIDRLEMREESRD